MKGTGVGQEVLATDFVTASNRIQGVEPDFTTSPSTDSEYILTRRFRLDEYLRALQSAQQEMRDATPWPAVEQKVDRSIIIGCPLENATIFHGSGSATPTGWTESGTGTFSYNTTITSTDQSVNLQNTASNAHGVQQRLDGYVGGLVGASPPAYAKVFCTTASRVNFQLNYGGTNGSKTVTHGGTGWEVLAITNLTVPQDATTLTFDVQISSGTQINAYLDWVDYQPHRIRHEYPLNTANNYFAIEGNMTASKRLDGESTSDMVFQPFDVFIPSTLTGLNLQSTKDLVLKLDESDWDLRRRILSVNAWGYHAALSAVTTTYTGNPRRLRMVAKAILLESVGDSQARTARDAAEVAKQWSPKVKLPILRYEPN